MFGVWFDQQLSGFLVLLHIGNQGKLDLFWNAGYLFLCSTKKL